MRRHFFTFCLNCLLFFPLIGQAQFDLHFYADVLVNAEQFEHRQLAQDSLVINIRKYLKKNLMLPQLLAPFGFVMSPDSTFQILSWQLMDEGAAERTFGLVYKIEDSTLIELNDVSKFQSEQYFGSFLKNRWIGGVYTKLFPHPSIDSVFIAYGYNRINSYETLYILEPISVSGDVVTFGFPLFENSDGEVQDRLIWTVTNGAPNPIECAGDLSRIIAPHLAQVPYGKGVNRMINVPDGTYEYWEWDGELWRYNDRLYEQRFQKLIIDSSRTKETKRDIFGRKQR